MACFAQLEAEPGFKLKSVSRGHTAQIVPQVSFRDCPVNTGLHLPLELLTCLDGGGKRVRIKGLFTG